MKAAISCVAELTSSCDLEMLRFFIRSSRTLMLCTFSLVLILEAMVSTDGMVDGEGVEKREGFLKCVRMFLWVSQEFP
jgi:hypothetical protein